MSGWWRNTIYIVSLDFRLEMLKSEFSNFICLKQWSPRLSKYGITLYSIKWSAKYKSFYNACCVKMGAYEHGAHLSHTNNRGALSHAIATTTLVHKYISK